MGVSFQAGPFAASPRAGNFIYTNIHASERKLNY